MLRAMLTKDDKSWIAEEFARELKPVRDSVDLLRKKVSDISFEKIHSDLRFNTIEASGVRSEEKLDKLITMLDGFSGKVADLDQENKMGAVTLKRHSTQIHELATATSTKISN